MAESVPDAGQWLAAARDGDSVALGKALENCRRYLLLVAERQLDTGLQAKGGASDLVQETFLDAQRDFAQFQGTTDSELLAWLRQVLVNNLGHFTRRYRDTGMRDVGREVRLPADDSSGGPVAGLAGLAGLAGADPSPSAQAMEREQAQALQQALTRLPEDYNRVLTLRFRDGKSFEEIGRLLDRSPDAARKLWARAMERLRQEWGSPP